MESKASPKHNQIKPPKFTDTENRLMAPRKWGGPKISEGGQNNRVTTRKDFKTSHYKKNIAV